MYSDIKIIVCNGFCTNTAGRKMVSIATWTERLTNKYSTFKLTSDYLKHFGNCSDRNLLFFQDSRDAAGRRINDANRHHWSLSNKGSCGEDTHAISPAHRRPVITGVRRRKAIRKIIARGEQRAVLQLVSRHCDQEDAAKEGKCVYEITFRQLACIKIYDSIGLGHPVHVCVYI